MIPYLAHNAQPKTYSTLNVTNNPCPTCRQNYCTVPTTILDTFLRSNNDNDAPTTNGGGVDGRDRNRWGLEENTTATTTPVVGSVTHPFVTDAAELLPDIPAVAYRPAAPYSNRDRWGLEENTTTPTTTWQEDNAAALRRHQFAALLL